MALEKVENGLQENNKQQLIINYFIFLILYFFKTFYIIFLIYINLYLYIINNHNFEFYYFNII
jgi:hypothetical protein